MKQVDHLEHGICMAPRGDPRGAVWKLSKRPSWQLEDRAFEPVRIEPSSLRSRAENKGRVSGK